MGASKATENSSWPRASIRIPALRIHTRSRSSSRDFSTRDRPPSCSTYHRGRREPVQNGQPQHARACAFGKGVEEWRRFARPQSAIGLTRATCSARGSTSLPSFTGKTHSAAVSTQTEDDGQRQFTFNLRGTGSTDRRLVSDRSLQRPPRRLGERVLPLPLARRSAPPARAGPGGAPRHGYLHRLSSEQPTTGLRRRRRAVSEGRPGLGSS